MIRREWEWAALARRLLLGAIPPGTLLLAWYLGTRGGGSLLPTIGEVAQVLTHPFEEPPLLDSLPIAAHLGTATSASSWSSAAREDERAR